MNILAIETATSVAAIAISSDEGTEEVEASRDMHHVETLVPCIQDHLRQRSWTMRDLDLIVVDIGPGLFTGLRVGVSAARSFAAALDCAIVGVSSLEVLARQRRQDEDCWSVIDARRGEVFAQHFLGDQAVSDPLVLTPEALGQLAGDQTVLIGDGAQRYRDVFASMGLVVNEDVVTPSPAFAIELVKARHLTTGQDLRSIVPMYLRDPDAVANFHVLDRFKS